MNTAPLIAATLAAHQNWGFRILKGEVSCAGPGCDWAVKASLQQSGADLFRDHQAEQIAAVLAEQPEQPAQWGPRDDLTVFAALVARLGGDVTVTWAEADRLRGVHVTRWDEPAHMRYRFTLGAPEFDTPADLGVGPGRIALQMPDGSYKSADEIRAEAATMTDAVVEYELGDPEPKLRIPPAHECETWMIRRGDTGGRYCASCGKDQ